MYKEMLELLTDNYSKDENSNIGKLFKIIGRQLEELDSTFRNVKNWRDIDQAQGKVLDRAGHNVLEYRGDKDDELYRDYIKIKIISNLSKGDIETINTVAEFLLKDKYIGAEETWNNPLYNDIAGVAMKVKPRFGEMLKTPHILNRVKAGGIGLHWLSEDSMTHKLYYGITNRQLKTNSYYPYSLEDIKINNPLNIGISSRVAKTSNYSINIMEDTKTNNQIFFIGICKRLKEIKMEVEHV